MSDKKYSGGILDFIPSSAESVDVSVDPALGDFDEMIDLVFQKGSQSKVLYSVLCEEHFKAKYGIDMLSVEVSPYPVPCPECS